MENIGKYRIEEKIGGGGFGEVFKGYDPFIKRHVAVKTCSSEDEETQTRFFQEAEIAGNLHHRNITTVYDFGVHDGLPYLIQEYLSGEDLDVKIKRRDFLPFPEKLYYLLQIARGLAYAHSKGVIHRDIKPANIRILEDGTARIMDFGIAKLAQQESGLTQTGMTLGTAAYLAPEQVRGDAVDHRTDIFSYGVLAYELLTYERPFQGERISTVLYQLLNHQAKAITEVWPAAPPELVAIVDRCLEKDAARRFADGSVLVRNLETLQKRGRGATPAAAERSDQATRLIRMPAAPAAPPARAGARTAAAPEAGQRIDDLEYSLTPEEGTRPRMPTAQAPAAFQTRPSRFAVAGRWLFLLMAIGSAAAGWWFGMRSEPGFSPTTSPPDQSAAVLDFPDDGAAALEAEEAAEDEGAAAATDEAPPTTGTRMAEAAATATPPPPPAPTTGKLVLPGVGWTDAMAVRIDTQTFELLRQRTIELPPGRYEAVFELTTEDYSPATRTVEVVIAAGESQRLSIPIPRPGALSVRPMLGHFQGQVQLDGEPLGATPLSKIQREPGDYTIEILPRSGGGEGLRKVVTLKADREVILTFDLDAGTVTSHTKALAL